jgi:hypothetical protein
MSIGMYVISFTLVHMDDWMVRRHRQSVDDYYVCEMWVYVCSQWIDIVELSVTFGHIRWCIARRLKQSVDKVELSLMVRC